MQLRDGSTRRQGVQALSPHVTPSQATWGLRSSPPQAKGFTFCQDKAVETPSSQP